jgi:hypothetical protein
MSSESRRLDILSAREITDLYGLPSFTDEERRLYFDLSPTEQTAVDAVHTRVAAVQGSFTHVLDRYVKQHGSPTRIFQGKTPVLYLRSGDGR